MRVLENLKNMIHETNEHALPKCRETMHDNLNQVLQRCKPAIFLYCFISHEFYAKMYLEYLVGVKEDRDGCPVSEEVLI